MPAAYAGSGVVGGKMYAVGGCTDECGTTDAFAYDPSTDRWSAIAPYPKPVAWESCGGIGGKLYCAGGLAGISTYRSTYVYDPADDHWTQLADLPIDLWASAYAAAGDQLVVSGGITHGRQVEVRTNQGFAYDPATDAWEKLPNSTFASYRGGGACGFYKVGGAQSQFGPAPQSELLPGLDACGGSSELSWLGEDPAHVVVPAGASVTISVSFDAAAVDITQPGTMSATLTVGEDTPYHVPDVAVTMNVTPPRTWGKIVGTVTGAACDGSAEPLAGATVQVDSIGGDISLLTDNDGHYGYWLDGRNNPFTFIVAKDSWQPKVRTVRVKARRSTEQNFTLEADRPCR